MNGISYLCTNMRLTVKGTVSVAFKILGSKIPMLVIFFFSTTDRQRDFMSVIRFKKLYF